MGPAGDGAPLTRRTPPDAGRSGHLTSWRLKGRLVLASVLPTNRHQGGPCGTRPTELTQPAIPGGGHSLLAAGLVKGDPSGSPFGQTLDKTRRLSSLFTDPELTETLDQPQHRTASGPYGQRGRAHTGAPHHTAAPGRTANPRADPATAHRPAFAGSRTHHRRDAHRPVAGRGRWRSPSPCPTATHRAVRPPSRCQLALRDGRPSSRRFGQAEQLATTVLAQLPPQWPARGSARSMRPRSRTRRTSRRTVPGPAPAGVTPRRLLSGESNVGCATMSDQYSNRSAAATLLARRFTA